MKKGKIPHDNERLKRASEKADLAMTNILEEVGGRFGKSTLVDGSGAPEVPQQMSRPSSEDFKINSNEGQASDRPFDDAEERNNARQDVAHQEKALETTGEKRELGKTDIPKAESLSKKDWVIEKERLEEEVALARQAYIETLKIQEKELGLYEKIKKTLAIKVELKEDSALADTKKVYQAKLKELQDAELGRIQETGLKNEAMSVALEQALRSLRIDEKLRLYEAKIAADLAEREVTISGKMISHVEKIVGWYQKQPMKTKLLIAAGFMAGAGAASLAGAVFAGGSLVAIRRSLAMASTGTAANAIMEKRDMAKRKKELEAEADSVGKIMGTGEEMVQMFQDKCARFFETVEADVQEWQRSDQKRRLIAAGIGIGGGLAISEAMQLGMEHGGNDLVREGLAKFGIHIQGAAGTMETGPKSVPGMPGHEALVKTAETYVVASPEDQIKIQNTSGLSDMRLRELAADSSITKDAFSHPVTVENNDALAGKLTLNSEAPSVASTQAVEEYLNEHAVERGDNLWKYSMSLGQSVGLENNIDQMRFSKLLENAIRAKLEAHPDLLAGSGFKDAESLKLITGKNLNIGSVLNAEEIENIANETQKNVLAETQAEMTAAMPRIAETPHSSGMGDEVIIGKSNGVVQAYAREEAAMGIKIGGAVGATTLGAGVINLASNRKGKREAGSLSKPTERIEPTLGKVKEEAPEDPQDALYKPGMDISTYMLGLENEELRSSFRKEIRRLGDDIFLSDLYRGDKNKDYSLNRTIIHLNVQNILDLHQEGFVFLGNEEEQKAILSLDNEQGKRLKLFTETCLEIFGKIAEPGRNEDIKNYLARMTALSMEKKKPIELSPYEIAPAAKAT